MTSGGEAEAREASTCGGADAVARWGEAAESEGLAAAVVGHRCASGECGDAALKQQAPLLEMKGAGFAYTQGSRGEGVHGVDLRVMPGEVVVLCGESGCGKSTVTRMANGLAPHFYEGTLSGEVWVCGNDVSAMRLDEIGGLVGSVFQNPRTQFFTVDVAGEVAFACENQGLAVDDIRGRVERTARDFSLEGLMGCSLFDLSGGQKQRVACASVSAAEPRLFVLDEPSSNLDVPTISLLRRVIERWRGAGCGVLVAEHRLHYLAPLIDRAYLMAGGRVSRVLSGDELRAATDRALASWGLRPLSLAGLVSTRLQRVWEQPSSTDGEGREEAPLAAEPADGDGVALLDAPAGRTRFGADMAADSVARRFEVCSASFSYRRGKRRARGIEVDRLSLPQGAVIALIGDNGAGKTTFVNWLAGLSKGKGFLEWDDECLGRRERLARTFVVMQDVNHQLFCESVLDEVLISLPRDEGLGCDDRTACAERAREILSRLDLADVADEHPRSLSGGQKQRVCVAAALASGRRFVVYDEPTSGLDLRHMREVARIVGDVAREGRTQFVVTHDPEFIMACCTYVYRMENGGVVEAYPLDEVGARHLADFFAREVL